MNAIQNKLALNLSHHSAPFLVRRKFLRVLLGTTSYSIHWFCFWMKDLILHTFLIFRLLKNKLRFSVLLVAMWWKLAPFDEKLLVFSCLTKVFIRFRGLFSAQGKRLKKPSHEETEHLNQCILVRMLPNL